MQTPHPPDADQCVSRGSPLNTRESPAPFWAENGSSHASDRETRSHTTRSSQQPGAKLSGSLLCRILPRARTRGRAGHQFAHAAEMARTAMRAAENRDRQKGVLQERQRHEMDCGARAAADPAKRKELTITAAGANPSSSLRGPHLVSSYSGRTSTTDEHGVARGVVASPRLSTQRAKRAWGRDGRTESGRGSSVPTHKTWPAR